MIYKTPEGTHYRIGINYWFPKENNTLWRIVLCIPLLVWYQRDYYDALTGQIRSGWRMKKLSYRVRMRNKAKFPASYRPMLITNGSIYDSSLFI